MALQHRQIGTSHRPQNKQIASYVCGMHTLMYQLPVEQLMLSSYVCML